MPVSKAERHPLLDILRGFALLGVLLDNLFGFTGWGFQTMDQWKGLPTWPADGVVGMAELVFVNGKFYSLFCLLFGIGFSIILSRNEERGINPLGIYYRRLFVLLIIFGLPHLIIFWEGDILTLYALVAMLLPLFRKCSNKTLLIWVICLIASPILVDTFYVIFHLHPGDFLEKIAQPIDKRHGVPLSSNEYGKYLYTRENGWQHWVNWQSTGYLYRYAYIINSNRIEKVLGMFLLGYLSGRNMVYARPDQFVRMLQQIRRWGFWFGIPASIAGAYFEATVKEIPDPLGLLRTLTYALGVVPLSLAYTASITLIWVKNPRASRLNILQPMGRMALTNYLMQTFIAILIFYSVGLRLGGNIGPSLFIPLGVLIYLFQIGFSYVWLKFFNYGPFEYIWRLLTYGRRINTGKKDPLLR
jgi:uncharacterized protein